MKTQGCGKTLDEKKSGDLGNNQNCSGWKNSCLFIIADPIEITIKVTVCNFVYNWAFTLNRKENRVFAGANIGIESAVPDSFKQMDITPVLSRTLIHKNLPQYFSFSPEHTSSRPQGWRSVTYKTDTAKIVYRKQRYSTRDALQFGTISTILGKIHLHWNGNLMMLQDFLLSGIRGAHQVEAAWKRHTTFAYINYSILGKQP